MEKEKDIFKIAASIEDGFIKRLIEVRKLTEGQTFKMLVENRGGIGTNSELMDFLISKMASDAGFFDTEVKECIIIYAGVFNMNRLLMNDGIPIFDKEELNEIYKFYTNYDTRELVEAKLWSGNYLGE